MKHYELMSIWRTVRNRTEDMGFFEVSIEHDYDAPLPQYGDADMVDSDSVAIGSPMEIVKYILKEDLKNYKLIKKENRPATKRK